MKTKMMCLFLTLWMAKDGFSQTQDLKYLDSVLGRKYLSADEYSYKFNKLFRMTDLGDNTAGLNHFVSTNITEGKFALNVVLNTKRGSNFTFKVNGGATDGIFSLFNQNKLNSTLSADVSYNRLIKAGSQLSFYDEDFQQLWNPVNTTSLKKRLDRIDAINNYLPQLKKRKRAENRRQIIQIASFNFKDAKETRTNKTDTKLAITDSLISKESLVDKQLEILEGLKFTRIKYKTLQFGLSAENNRFNLFNSAYADLESQLARKSNVNMALKIQLNSYYWHQPHRRTHSCYWLLGAALTYQDNFSDLDAVELTDQETFADSTTTRILSKKTNAYRGEYKTKIPGARIYGDLYVFDSKNVMALHLYPELNIQKNQDDPVLNFGIGLYFAFKGQQPAAKPEDKVSKVNAELYGEWNDLGNVNNSTGSTFKRTEVGIRLSFPITFVNP